MNETLPRLKYQKTVFICGPTASGKSALAHALAEGLKNCGQDCVLVNMDAFQFYKGFDIGTAKPSRTEQAKYNYRLVDFLEPHQNIDAQTFAALALEQVERARQHKRFVLVVGGSGLYLRALLHGLDDLPSRDDGIRAFIRESAAVLGKPAVYAWLKALDPLRAQQLHPNDLVRIERALEIYLLTGRRPSEVSSRTGQPMRQQRRFECFVLNRVPAVSALNQQIATRTKLLLQSGWIQEVADLLEKHQEKFKEMPAARAIGYLEIAEHLQQQPQEQQHESQLSFAELCNRISTLTRQYAKRQLTWMSSAQVDLVLEDETQVDAFVKDYLHWASKGHA